MGCGFCSIGCIGLSEKARPAWPNRSEPAARLWGSLAVRAEHLQLSSVSAGYGLGEYTQRTWMNIRPAKSRLKDLPIADLLWVQRISRFGTIDGRYCRLT
jgi:hypothetical protein